MRISLKLFGLLFITSPAFAVTPTNIYPIIHYSAATEASSPSIIRQKISALVTAYNRRFLANNQLMSTIQDKSDAATQSFINLQNQTISDLKAANAYQLLFTITDGGNLKIDIYAITDEAGHLAALGIGKTYFSDLMGQSALMIRPFSSLIDIQTVQDAKDLSGFAVGTQASTSDAVGGALILQWATNVTFFSGPPLDKRTWQILTWTLSNVSNSWSVIDPKTNQAVKTVIVAGGSTSGVKLKQIIYK